MSNNLNSILQELYAPDSNKRSSAVFALDKLGDSQAVLDELLTALATEDDLMVREDITWALVRRKEQAIAPLIKDLQHERWQVRHNAAHVLGKIASPLAVPALCKCLNDESAVVVAKACLALSQIGDESAIPALVGILGHEKLEVQSTLLDVLEGFGETAIPALADALQSEDAAVREQVVDVLGHIDGKESLALLESAIKDPVWQVRFATLPALNNHRAKALIAAMVNDPDERVRKVAQSLIAKLR